VPPSRQRGTDGARDGRSTGTGEDPPPRAFVESAAAVRAAPARPGVVVEEVAPPRRIAPFAVALTGHLPPESEHEAGAAAGSDQAPLRGGADGRFVLLHDPSRPEGWGGEQRVVALVTATVEPDLADDPLLADVAWTWLVDELAAAGAVFDELGGTVTRVSSTSFGVLGDRPGADQVELRASWSPRNDLGTHVEGWTAALCRVAGVPPVAPGVVLLRRA
jgi:hypothetical protein